MSSGTLADARLSSNVALLNGNNAFTGSNTLAGVTVATNASNVLSGSFTGNLTGNVTGNVIGNAATAMTAGVFSGPLSGDVTGTQGATVVSSVGGQSAANVAAGAATANAATSANTANAMVKRDASGNFSAGSISVGSVSAGTLSGDGSGVTNLNGANLVAGSVAAAHIAPGAAMANLQASGQSAVPSGGMIISTNASDATLVAAGYVKLGQLVLESDAWVQRNTPPVSSGRGYFNAVWTGTEMIFWSGFNKNTEPNDGARYNPATDTWRPVTTTGAPNARSSFSAVWSGTEMLIWGGYPDKAQGARYNPASDSWRLMATTGQPSGRAEPGMVWTGSRMIIWGGFNPNTSAFGDGAQYDPATDTWHPISTAGAPSPRHAHTVLWTGTEMLVWGGRPGAWELNVCYGDGARYNPVTDTWSAISKDGAPSSRFGQAGVWTGSEMLVWSGGNNYVGYFNDGGRYNPANNTWRPITSTGAPQGRGFFQMTCGVWTGSQLIVWGGSIDSYVVNSGGCYDPVSDEWIDISRISCPSPRYAYRAVWTGTEMIMYGGADMFNSVFNDTFSYNPRRRIAYLYQRP